MTRIRSFLLPKAKALSPTVVRLGIVSFFADVSSEMLYPITPIFLTATLGASMLSVGLIEGFAEAVASLLKTYAGARSDRIRRRRPFIVGGYLLAAIAKPMIGFATGWPLVLFARGLDRTGKGVRTAPRDALLSDSIGAAEQGEAFGWHRTMDTLGAALGPLLAILFLSRSADQLRPLYFWALIPGLASVGVASTIRESSRPHESMPSKAPERWKWSDASRSFKTYLVAWGCFSLANSSDVFLILKAKSSGISLRVTILMYCFYSLVSAVTSPYLGRLSDRLSRRKLLIFGLIVFCSVYLGFAVAGQAWQYWALFGLYGIYVASTDGVGKALVVDLVPAEFKGTGIGMLGTITGVTTLGASVVAGLLWDRVGSGVPFLYGVAGAAIAAFLLLGVEA